MARKISVEILGDSRLLERAFGRSSKAAKEFNRDLGRTFRGGIAGSGIFASLGRSVAFASGAFLGGAGFVSVMKTSVDASSNLAEQMSKTNAVFGDSAKAVQNWSTTSATAMGLAQDQALETAGSFGALLRPLGLTGKEAANQSKRLTELGADLASFYNTSVTDALDAVRSGIVGESEPLRRYGVLLSEARVTQEALTETGKTNAKQLTQQEKVLARVALIYKDAGLAQGDFQRTSGGLANQQRILNAQIRNLEIAIGNNLKPVILDVVGSLNDWLAKSENQRQVTEAVKGAVDLLVGAARTLKGMLEAVNSVTGSTKNTLKLLLGVLLLFKTLKLASALANIATQVAQIGTNAQRTRGQLGKPGAGGAGGWFGPITAAALALGTVTGGQVWKNIFKLGEQLGILKKKTEEAAPPFKEMARVAEAGAAAVNRATSSIAAGARAVGAAAAAAATGGGGGDPFTRAQRNAFFDARISRLLLRAQYKELQGQLAVYKQVAAALTKRIAATKDVTRKRKLEDELLSVQAQIRSTRAELVANALQAAQDRAEKIRAAAEKAAQRRAAAAARRQGRQFRALGFGPGGEDLVPGLGALRKQLASVRNLSGLTAKMRAQIEQIGKVLAGKWGKVGKDVRAKIKEMLDGIRNELKGGADGGTARTGFVHVSPAFSLVGAHPGRRSPVVALAGAGGVHIAGNVNVYNTHNIGDLEHQLTKRQTARAHNRRGAR